MERLETNFNINKDTQEKVHKFERGGKNILTPGWIENSIKEALKDAPTNVSKTGYLCELFRKDAGRVFQDKEKEFETALIEIGNIPYQNDEEFGRLAAEILRRFLEENYGLEELEKRIRGERLKTSHEHVLSDTLYYGLYKNTLTLHVLPSSTLSRSNQLRSLREGLKKLADELKNNENLENIKIVSAKSWIVEEHPGLMEKLGFTIEAEKTDRATITRERFLELYGSWDAVKK